MINTIFRQYDYEILPKQKETWDKYCKIVQWGRRHPTRFVETFLNLQLTDYQKYIFLNSWCATTAVILCSRGTGKAESLDTKVWTQNKDGYPHTTTIGELKVGDKIYDSQGELSEVIHLNPIIFDDYYEVEFNDGEIIKCNADHLWLVHCRDFHKIGQSTSDLRLLSTDYIASHLNRNKGNHAEKWNDWNFHVPLTKPIQYAKTPDLPIDPYVLGYFLGDGSCGSGYITCWLNDIEEATQLLKECSTTTHWRKVKNRDNTGIILIDRCSDIQKKLTLEDANATKSQARKIAQQKSLKTRLGLCEDVLHNKHIPDKYLYSSIEDRLALLQGLMDTDGTIDEKGKCEFVQEDYNLARQVYQLICSLGMKCTLTHKITNYLKKDGTYAECWRIYFVADKTMPVFRLKRKYDRLPEKTGVGSDRKAIIRVTKINKKIPMRCITMRNNDGTFLCGDNYTVTHNSFFSAPFIMTRSLLIPNHVTYVISVSGGQSSATFSKMEDLANNNIASAIGVSSVFLDNVKRPHSKLSGFTHSKDGCHVELFNGSEVTSLNSVPEHARGARSNLNVYDESAFIPKELFTATLPFTAVSADFRTSKGLNAELYPRQIPNLNLMLSSASDTTSEMYAQYREAFRQMMLGNTNYFVCDLDYHISTAPFLNGKPMKPLVSMEEVERMYSTQPYKAEREFANKWSADQGENVLVKRSTIEKNSQTYYPQFANDSTQKFIVAYDPSSRQDNSVILVAELIRDETKGLMLKLSYMKNLVERLGNGQAAIIQKPEQVEILKGIMLDFNYGYLDYDGIDTIFIDAGAGG